MDIITPKKFYYDEYGINYIKKLDYLSHKDELLAKLSKPKEEIIKEDNKEEESVLEQRKKEVLEFEHPDDYIDENGNYQYDNIGFGFNKSMLEFAAKQWMLRYKSKKHFEDIDKIEYDYATMKQNNANLNNEFHSYYKMFNKFTTLKHTIPVLSLIHI